MRLYRSMRLRNKCAFWFRCTVPGQKAEPSRKRTEKWLGYHLPNRIGSIVVLAGCGLTLQLIEFRCARNRIQAANRYLRNSKSERHPKPPWTRITVFRTSAGAENDLSIKSKTIYVTNKNFNSKFFMYLMEIKKNIYAISSIETLQIGWLKLKPLWKPHPDMKNKFKKKW